VKLKKSMRKAIPNADSLPVSISPKVPKKDKTQTIKIKVEKIEKFRSLVRELTKRMHTSAHKRFNKTFIGAISVMIGISG
jgi:hypothetical protein